MSRADDDLRSVLTGEGTLEELIAAAERVRLAVNTAICKKEAAARGARPKPRPPTALQASTADAVDARLSRLKNDWDARLSALEGRASRLTVADVKRVLQGATVFVIQSQDYSCVARLDNLDFMFEDPSEPLGYFQGGGDTDAVGVGGGSDVWYVADRQTLRALGGLMPK